MKFRFPALWDGTVAVLASGPSMSQEVADKCKGLGAIVINDTYRLAPWADVLYAADHAWWLKYPEARKFAGLRLTCDMPLGKDVLAIKSTGRLGFDPDPHHVRTGGNSGYQAVQLAVHGGAKRILLCGFDMHSHGGKHHWHGKHPQGLRNTGDSIYVRWIANFETLVQPLADLGIEVINCTPGSALKHWPFVPLEDAIEASGEPVQGRSALPEKCVRSRTAAPRVQDRPAYQ